MCVAGLALAASASGSSALKYFGVWELEQADPVADNVKDFANFLFTSADMGQINRRVGDTQMSCGVQWAVATHVLMSLLKAVDG